MRKGIGFIALLLVLCLMPWNITFVIALENEELQAAAIRTAQYITETVKKPQVGSIGGEWAIIGLARSRCDVPPKYYSEYYKAVEDYVVSRKGILHEKKYTEYSRVILALTAIGRNPSNVGGYDLLMPLGDFDKTVWQGINGPIWALIALDSGDYAMPQNSTAKTQASRQMYIDKILSSQLTDGGWSLEEKRNGITHADPDVTGMALSALAKYKEQENVKTAIERAVACLSKMQGKDGGYESWGMNNSESAVQVIVALCELDISLKDERFIKDGKTLMDNLFSYRKQDGSFVHTSSGSSSQMTTEQGLYAITAALRVADGKSSLYCMNDVSNTDTEQKLENGMGLYGKNPNIKSMPIIDSGIAFEDVVNLKDREAIEALAAREIIKGMGDGTFRAQQTVTRAEFCTIITRGLGLAAEDTAVFTDVPSDKWYAGYVGTANKYGIVSGVSDEIFNPEGIITCQEAATMIKSAAGLCGLDTNMSDSEVMDMLAQFEDYVTVADWAKSSVAFCYKEDILDKSALNIEPNKPILRGETAQMLFNMLVAANLI